jgi:hypothetical protein
MIYHDRLSGHGRLAAPGDHRGSFGTCGPGARSSTTTTRTSGPEPGPPLNPPVDPASFNTGARRDEHCLTPCETRLCSQSARAAHGTARCTRPLADSPAYTPRTRRGQALHGLSPLANQRHRLLRERTSPGPPDLTPAGAYGPAGSPLAKILSHPRACHRQAPADTRAARTLPRPSHSDWTGSGQHHRLGQSSLRGAILPDKSLSQPRTCHCQAPAVTRAARTPPGQ